MSQQPTENSLFVTLPSSLPQRAKCCNQCFACIVSSHISKIKCSNFTKTSCGHCLVLLWQQSNMVLWMTWSFHRIERVRCGVVAVTMNSV